MKVFVLVILISVLGLQAYGQVSNMEALKHAFHRLDSVDTKSMKSGLFLNRGFFLGQNFGIAKNLGLGDSSRNVFFISSEEINALFRGVEKAKIKREYVYPHHCT